MILVGNSSLPTSVYSVSQKISSISFSYNISPTENFKMNFTCLLYVHSYAKLQKNYSFISNSDKVMPQ